MNYRRTIAQEKKRAAEEEKQLAAQKLAEAKRLEEQAHAANVEQWRKEVAEQEERGEYAEELREMFEWYRKGLYGKHGRTWPDEEVQGLLYFFEHFNAQYNTTLLWVDGLSGTSVDPVQYIRNNEYRNAKEIEIKKNTERRLKDTVTQKPWKWQTNYHGDKYRVFLHDDKIWRPWKDRPAY